MLMQTNLLPEKLKMTLGALDIFTCQIWVTISLLEVTVMSCCGVINPNRVIWQLAHRRAGTLPLPLLLTVPSSPWIHTALAKTVFIFFVVHVWSVHKGWWKGKDEIKQGFILDTSRLWEMQYHSIVHVHAHELLQCQVLKLWAKTNPEKNPSASGHRD